MSHAEKQAGFIKRLKTVIVTAAESGEIGCPDKHGFEVLDWVGKTCINADCAKCWRWAIEHEVALF